MRRAMHHHRRVQNPLFCIVMARASLLILVLLLLLPSCRTSFGVSASIAVDIDKGRITELGGSIEESISLSGKVTILEDLLIPEGVTLTLAENTDVTVVASEGTRTDAQFVSTGTEVLVRGRLIARPGVHITTASGARGSWGGIIVAAPDGLVDLGGVEIAGARYGILVLTGTGRARRCIFRNNEVGIAAAPEAQVEVSGNTFVNNITATAAYHQRTPIRSPEDAFTNNDDDALGLLAAPPEIAARTVTPVLPAAPPVTREYIGETALDEDTTWSGTVVIDGQVAVPPEVTLTILPGARVLFTFRDTNRDGLGESWIIVQGTIRVLGDEDAWVLFDAENEVDGPGSWDSLSVIASDSDRNRISHTVFRRGVKAFHSHFSRTTLDHVVFTDNLRGVQFQESTDTVIDRAYLARNQSGMRFRDSTVTLSNILAENNVAGINFLRCAVAASDIVVSGSLTESLVSRESDTTITRAAFTGNVRGPRFKGGGETVTMSETVVAGNLTEGLSFNRVQARVSESALIDNGWTGLSVTDAAVSLSMTRIDGNGRFAVDNNGSSTVDARENDWGTGEEPHPDRIYDGSDEPGIGEVLTDRPRRFELLLPGMAPTGVTSGELLVVGDVITPADRTLKLEPGTLVFFSEVPADSLFDLCSEHPGFPGSELHVLGRLEAIGTPGAPVTFSPARRTLFELDPTAGPGRAQWGAVNLTGGRGASFENCYLFRAATGIHAREAGEVRVQDCVFTANLVGLRFSRSEVEITGNAFELNNTGIRFHENGGLIADNLFDANGTGIFVTGNPEKVAIRNNTFVGQFDYNVKLGIHVTEDVTVDGGAFGMTTGKTVEDMIFDREDDPDLGRVIVVP